jgi:hypothetical protein
MALCWLINATNSFWPNFGCNKVVLAKRYYVGRWQPENITGNPEKLADGGGGF